MAKELPYFKFEPAEWLTGRINLETFEVQGAYINISCVYWQRLGNLSIKEAKLRLKEQYNYLIESEYITELGSSISIKYLDLQLTDRKAISDKRAEAGAKGGKANAKQLVSNSKAEENRREKKREEKKINLSLESTFKDQVCRQLKIDSQEYLSKWDEFSIANDLEREEKEVKKHFFNWLKTQNLNLNIKAKFDPYG